LLQLSAQKGGAGKRFEVFNFPDPVFQPF
jgi:hypothetical protein